jgi:hypothetical protein
MSLHLHVASFGHVTTRKLDTYEDEVQKVSNPRLLRHPGTNILPSPEKTRRRLAELWLYLIDSLRRKILS